MRLRVRFFTYIVVSALGLTVILPTAAQADTPGCVTRSEFGRATHGMKIDRVHNIFDTNGSQASSGQDPSTGTKWQERWYQACGSGLVRFAEVRYVKRSGTWQVSRKDW